MEEAKDTTKPRLARLPRLVRDGKIDWRPVLKAMKVPKAANCDEIVVELGKFVDLYRLGKKEKSNALKARPKKTLRQVAEQLKNVADKIDHRLWWLIKGSPKVRVKSGHGPKTWTSETLLHFCSEARQLAAACKIAASLKAIKPKAHAPRTLAKQIAELMTEVDGELPSHEKHWAVVLPVWKIAEEIPQNATPNRSIKSTCTEVLTELRSK